MRIADAPISLADLKAMAGGRFGNLVKAVVDVERKIIALDGEKLAKLFLWLYLCLGLGEKQRYPLTVPPA